MSNTSLQNTIKVVVLKKREKYKKVLDLLNTLSTNEELIEFIAELVETAYQSGIQKDRISSSIDEHFLKDVHLTTGIQDDKNFPKWTGPTGNLSTAYAPSLTTYMISNPFVTPSFRALTEEEMRQIGILPRVELK